MKQVLQMLLVLSIAAVCLTSDTTPSSIVKVARTRSSSTNSSVCVGSTPKPRFLVYRKSTGSSSAPVKQ